MSGILYFVPTPIGNLEDMTFRAIKSAERSRLYPLWNTRKGILLKHYEISKPLKSYHLHNEHTATEKSITDLKSGQNIAIITDAGTPGNFRSWIFAWESLCRWRFGDDLFPGATAFVPALVVSGLLNHDFYFAGFYLKKGRQTKLKQLAEEKKKTIVLYESPHKINTTLEQIKEFFGENTKK